MTGRELTAQDIDRLVLTGIAAGGVVLSTTLRSADLNHRVTLRSDARADCDTDRHNIAVTKVFKRRRVRCEP